MTMEKQNFSCPCSAAAAALARVTKQLTLPDGFQVAIINLDTILREVAELKLTDTEAIRRELLERVEIYNDVTPGAEYDYSEALFREYRRQCEKPK